MDNSSQIKSVGVGKTEVLEIKKSGKTTIRAAKNSRTHVICRVDDSGYFSHYLTVELEGLGAECFVSAMFHGHQHGQHDFHVLMHHKAKGTKGDILIRGVYEDSSKGSFSGLIKIDKTAQLSNSFFQDNVLLLDGAMAVSVPTLEIEANEVKASHGSTTSRIDEDQLFYLQARGIPRPLARRMVIDGFFQPAVGRALALNQLWSAHP